MVYIEYIVASKVKVGDKASRVSTDAAYVEPGVCPVMYSSLAPACIIMCKYGPQTYQLALTWQQVSRNSRKNSKC